MLLWMATHNEKKSTKKATSSQPKLKEMLEAAVKRDPNLLGEWTVEYIDIGKPSHERICKVLMRTKYIVSTKETFDCQVTMEEDGTAVVKMRKRKKSEE